MVLPRPENLWCLRNGPAEVEPLALPTAGAGHFCHSLALGRPLGLHIMVLIDIELQIRHCITRRLPFQKYAVSPVLYMYKTPLQNAKGAPSAGFAMRPDVETTQRGFVTTNLSTQTIGNN